MNDWERSSGHRTGSRFTSEQFRNFVLYLEYYLPIWDMHNNVSTVLRRLCSIFLIYKVSYDNGQEPKQVVIMLCGLICQIHPPRSIAELTVRWYLKKASWKTLIYSVIKKKLLVCMCSANKHTFLENCNLFEKQVYFLEN